MLKKMVKKLTHFTFVNHSCDNVNGNLNRTEFDFISKEKLDELNNNKKYLPSISAIYRVKNGESSLESSILSVATICTEIIVVDNMSTDSTVNIVNKLREDLKNVCDIKLYTYKNKVRVAGSNYSIDKEYNTSTLAEFYTYCFKKGNSDYLMKVDAHYIFSLKGLFKIQKKISKTPRFIIFRGVEIFGKRMSYESFIFKNDKNYKFIDGKCYEEIKFSYNANILEKLSNCIFEPIYMHVKRLLFVKLPLTDNMAKQLYK